MQELDPVLSQIFDAASTALPEHAFLQQLTAQLRRARRWRLMWSALACIGLALVATLLALPVARVSLALAQTLAQGAPRFGAALLSPLGVAGAMLASLYVLHRARAR